MKANLTKWLLPGFYAVIVFMSFMDAAVYLSMRSIWFFIDKTLVGLSGANLPWAAIFFILFGAAFIYSLTLFKHRTKMKNIALPLILLILFSAIDIYLYIQLESSRNIVLTNLIAALPWLLAILTIVFLIILYPDSKICHNKVFKYITAAVLVLSVLLYLTNFGKVKITSGPVIQLVDSSNLSIVWTTNKNSTAYVEYGPDEKSLKREVAVHNGVIDANTTVHRVIIPVDAQSEFVYRVGSTKINHYYQNSVEYGNTVVSGFKKYIDYRLKDKISFYILSDIHENEDIYKKFLSRDDYDFIVLNGDMVNSVDSQKVIENKILKPISIYTDGTKPFYFVRGNHETRGASLRDLPDFISLQQDNFYYTFNAGPIFAVVLDSAEDKPDSHEEYSGLADFEKYLGTETTWLKILSQSEAYKNAKYKIAFTHIPLNSFDDLDETSYLKVYQKKWAELLNSMKIDAVFSGHSHKHKVIKADNVRFDFDNFIGSGDSQNEESYVAVRVEATSESMKVYYINTSGTIVNEFICQ